MAPPSSVPRRIAVAFGDGVADRRQRGDDGADRERGTPFVIDRRDDAVILQPELLFERQPRQGTLLQDGKRSEDSAGHRDGQRNSENQPSRDRSKLEHGNTGTP
jgi:hypothetical protein